MKADEAIKIAEEIKALPIREASMAILDLYFKIWKAGYNEASESARKIIRGEAKE